MVNHVPQPKSLGPKPPVTKETIERQKRATTFWLLLITFFSVLGFIGLSLFGPDPPIVISVATTHLTSPLATDGFPDYAAVIRADMSKGVTPENNGAIPLLKSMWLEHAEYFTAEESKLVLVEMGMEGLPSLSEQLTVLETPENRLAALRLLRKHWLLQHSDTDKLSDQERMFFLDAESDVLGNGNFNERLRSFLLGLKRWNYIRNPWSDTDIPFLAKWIDENEVAIDRLVKAAEYPGWYLPSKQILSSERDLFYLSSRLGIEETAAGILTGKSNCHLSNAQYDLAVQDALAVLRLANHVSKVPFVGAQYDSCSMHEMGCDQLIRIGVDSKVPSQVLREVLANITKRMPQERLIDAFDKGYRYSTLDAYLTKEARSWIQRHGFEVPDQLLFTLVNKTSTDWNVVLRDQNEYCDAIVAAASRPTWTQQQVALKALGDFFDNPVDGMDGWRRRFMIAKYLGTPSGRGKIYSLAYGGWGSMFSSLQSFFAQKFHVANHHQMTRLAIALAIYRAKSAKICGVPSVDPSSTQMNSQSVNVCQRMLASASRR